MFSTKIMVFALAALFISGVVYGGYRYVENLQQENRILASNNATLEASEASLKLTLETTKLEIDRVNKERDELNDELNKAREKMQRMVKLFSDHDFANLVDKKPGLIQNRINKGTAKVFKEFEEESK